MAFVPFVESDQPTMAAFNEKFQQNYEAAVEAGFYAITGTYTGTGTSGAGQTKNKITLPAKPFAVIVYETSYGFGTGRFCIGFLWGATATQLDTNTASLRGILLSYPDDLTVEWYASGVAEDSGNTQLNQSGREYTYIALVQKEE